MLKTMAVIPARMGSTRLAGKPLALIQGKPMVRLVYENTVATELFDDVVVATDDERIREVILAAGGRVAMTRPDHVSGTDRVAEVAETAGAEIFVNIQGDLPFVCHALLAPLVGTMCSELSVQMATVAVPLRDREQWLSPNVVKVVTDEHGFALYFSRAPIPSRRDDVAVPSEGFGLQHVGIYAFRKEFLQRFTSWSASPLERVERLEQLRALEAGMRIDVAVVDTVPLGVDTPADLERARRLLDAG